MTTDNETITPAAVVPPAETQIETPAAEVKPEVKAEQKPVPPMPTTAPPPGCEHLYDEKTGLWRVRNIAADIERAIEEREEKGPGEPTVDEAAGKAAAEAVHVPEILPDAMQHDEDLAHHVSEVATVLGGAGYSAPQIQRLVDLGGELALDVQEQPHYEEKEQVDAHLRKRWGSEYDNNLKATRAAANKLGDKFIAWLDQGHGNNLVVIELLSALGRGDFSVGKAEATKQMAALRASAPFKDKFHRDHQYTVNRYRIFANAAARGDDNGAGFEASLSKVLTSQIKGNVVAKPVAKPTAAAATTANAEASIGTIRTQLGKAKFGTPEYAALRVQLNEAYRVAYPGEQEG